LKGPNGKIGGLFRRFKVGFPFYLTDFCGYVFVDVFHCIQKFPECQERKIYFIFLAFSKIIVTFEIEESVVL